MMPRGQQYTTVMPYDARKKDWEAQRHAYESALALAQTFLTMGERVIHELQAMLDAGGADPERITQGYAKCLTLLEKGVKMQREIYKDLTELHYTLPKK